MQYEFSKHYYTDVNRYIEFFGDLEKNLYAKKLIFNRISKLAVENSYMELFYEMLQNYLDATYQSVDDVMELYK